MTDQIQGFRLSPQQRYLWLLQTGGTPRAAQMTCRISGAVDLATLRQAVQRVVRRHGILRTTFRRSPGMPLPLQVIEDHGRETWTEIDLQGEEAAEQVLQRRAADERAALEFAPQAGSVPLRCLLAHLGPAEHAFILTLPNLCADHLSLHNLLMEVAGGYGSDSEEGEDDGPVEYIQVSEWLHQMQEEQDPEAQKHWERFDINEGWRLDLPWRKTSIPKEIYDPQIFSFASSGLGDGVNRLAEALKASPREVLLAAWQLFLYRWTGQRKVVVGCTLDGRGYEELATALGPFARTVPVAAVIDPSLSFRDAVTYVRQALEEAEEWQEFYSVPEPGEGPLGCAAALLEVTPRASTFETAGLTFDKIETRVGSDRSLLTLIRADVEDTIRLTVRFDAERLEEKGLLRSFGSLENLVTAAAADPDTAAADLDLLTEADRRWLLIERNDTAAPLPTATLHTLVEAQADRLPNATAVRSEEVTWSYQELNHRANLLAARLRAAGVGPEVPVALLLPRSPEMVAAILAVLKAGGAYVPLEITYPNERLAYLISDSRPAVVLTTAGLAEQLPESTNDHPFQVLVLGADIKAPEEIPASDARAETGSATKNGLDHIAYILYTSGSTGRPKGVAVSHRSVVAYLQWAVDFYAPGPQGGSLVHTPMAFDLTVTSLFAPLLAGGCVHLAPQEYGPEVLSGEGEAPALLKLTPAHLDLLQRGAAVETETRWPRVMILGGEALRGEALHRARREAPDLRVINEYGPTEATVGCAVYEVPVGETLRGPVPIGGPIANARLYVLDPRGRPVPPGLAGELFLGGVGLARGYHRRAAQTAERFVPDPFSDQPGERLYRTGDLVRLLPSGDLVFVGRNDHQVKVRGFRIELGEVEAVLSAHPDVAEVAVVPHQEGEGGTVRLVAYLVAEGEAPGLEDLRDFLGARLPDYMVPSTFVPLDALPLTANGKVDRDALPDPAGHRLGLQQKYMAPRNPVEEVLSTLWRETLSVERVGILDNYFALGGDSMRSVRLVALARKAGLEFTVQDLFRFPTVEALATHLEAVAGAPEDLEADEMAELAAMLDELEGISEEETKREIRRRLKGEGRG